MRIYFSGIGGVGIGPLAMIAHDAGYAVSGSDREASLITQELSKRGIPVALTQDGHNLEIEHTTTPIDWFVHTAALPSDHPELQKARQLGIHTAKRDELLAQIIKEKNLRLIAVSGTHGKTTTTGMLIWALMQLGVPISYSVGSTLSFGPSGVFTEGSQYFIYECDEFDRNFLHFSPWLSLITTIEHDHVDTYPAKEDYFAAFRDFSRQSEQTITWEQYRSYLEPHPNDIYCASTDPALTLAGDHNRANATLALTALHLIGTDGTEDELVAAINAFPGTARRFEKLATNLYTDYGHHPTEIAATLQLAQELHREIVLVYQPHQNVRQHEIQDYYTTCMERAEKIFWLPTYLSREDPSLPILSSRHLARNLTNQEAVEFHQLDEALWECIVDARVNGKLVLVMGAGDIDTWVRAQLASEQVVHLT